MAIYTVAVSDLKLLPLSRICLCHNKAETVSWLELAGTTYMTTGDVRAATCVIAYVGAMFKNGQWAQIDQSTISANRHVIHEVRLADSAKTAMFQRKIVQDWSNFSGAHAGLWAKGLTIGKSMTVASFVMKSLKTGFDAISEPISAYSGSRFRDFTIADLKSYLGSRLSQPTIKTENFDLVAIPPKPLALSGNNEDMAKSNDTRVIPVILSAKPHGGSFAYDSDAFTTLNTGATGRVPFERVVAYGFRGDTRAPSEIKEAGGLWPNYTRPAHIARYQTSAQDQALNLVKFLTNQEYGGYVSTSKSYGVAKNFARGGWVYTLFVEGGFHLPGHGLNKGVLLPFNEQEIAMPGGFDWDDIVACRKLDSSGKFSGDVYVRPSFMTEEALAFGKVWELMSGLSQG